MSTLSENFINFVLSATQNAFVLHVELTHVTLTLDSVAVNQESLVSTVTAVR